MVNNSTSRVPSVLKGNVQDKKKVAKPPVPAYPWPEKASAASKFPKRKLLSDKEPEKRRKIQRLSKCQVQDFHIQGSECSIVQPIQITSFSTRVSTVEQILAINRNRQHTHIGGNLTTLNTLAVLSSKKSEQYSTSHRQLEALQQEEEPSIDSHTTSPVFSRVIAQLRHRLPEDAIQDWATGIGDGKVSAPNYPTSIY